MVRSGLSEGISANSIGSGAVSGDDSIKGGGPGRDVRPGMTEPVIDGSSCGKSSGSGGKKSVRSSSVAGGGS